MNLHQLLKIEQRNGGGNKLLQRRISPQTTNHSPAISQNNYKQGRNYPPKPKPPQQNNYNNRQPPSYQQKRQAPSYQQKNNPNMNLQYQNQQRQHRYTQNNFQQNLTNYQPRRQDNFENKYQNVNYQGRNNFQKNNPINQTNIPPPPSNYQQSKNKNFKKNYNDNNQPYQKSSNTDRNSTSYRGRGRTNSNYQINQNKKYNQNNYNPNTKQRGRENIRGTNNYQKNYQAKQKNYQKKQPIEEEQQVEEFQSEQEYQSQEQNQIQQQIGSDQQDEDQQDQESENLDYSSASQNQQAQQIEKQPLIQKIHDDGQIKAIDQMCGRQQFDQRLITFNQNNKDVKNHKLKLDTSRSFSIFEINKKTFRPDLRLTLKRFRRSANREQDNNEQDNMNVRRSIKALQKTILHINNQIIDGDRKKANDLAFPIIGGQSKIQFIQIYEFLWDRMRQMIKDITRLNYEEKMRQNIILLCQEMARFFIIAINQGRKKYQSKLQFDQKMNKQSLIKVLTPLMEIYTTSRSRLRELVHELKKNNKQITIQQIEEQMTRKKIFISPNQPQMTSYAILISQDYRKYIYENICAGFQNNQDNPLYNSYQIKQALQIQNSLRTDNSEKFFKILQSSQTDYVLSSLILHHVHWVRIKACKKIFQTFKFYDGQGTRKGILSSELKTMLRFKEGQNHQFNLFLRSINVSQISFNSSNYLIQNQGQADEDNYRMGQYIFDIDKTDRNLFTDQVPDFIRPVQDMENKITRQEIVKRDWYQSTYVEQIITSYLGQQFEGKKSTRFLNEKVNAKDRQFNEIEKQKQEQKKRDLMKLQEMRAGIKLKKKRNVFLKNLQDKLCLIFLKEKQKKQRIAQMFKLLLKKIKKTQIQFFQALQFNTLQQQEEQQTLLRMHQQTKIHRQFKNGINIQPYEFSRKKKQREDIKMSQILNRVKRKTTGIDQSIKNYLEKELTQMRRITDLQTFKIRIFYSSKILLNQNYQKILQKLIQQILGSGKTFQGKDGQKFILQNIQLKNILQIQTYALNKKNYSKTFGANCIIFVGIDSLFIKQIKQLMDFFGSIKRMVKQQFNIPLGMFTFGTQYIVDKQPLTIDFQDFSFLIPSLYSFNFQTKKTLRKLLQLSVNNFVNTQHPKIEAVPLAKVIKEIQQTLKYLKLKLVSYKQSFLIYQQYINMCFQKLVVIQKNYFTNFQTFENWLKILNDIGEDQPINEKNIEGIKYRIKNQYENIYNFLKSFHFTIPQTIFRQNNQFNHQDLLNICMRNLMRFDMQAQGNSRIVNDSLKSLQILDGRIYGDAFSFFKYFLYILSIAVQYFSIILPENFSFKIDFNQLILVFEEKRKYKRGKIIKQKTMMQQIFGNLIHQKNQQKRNDSLDINIHKRNQSISRGFVYQRFNWLQECKKKIKLNI